MSAAATPQPSGSGKKKKICIGQRFDLNFRSMLYIKIEIINISFSVFFRVTCRVCGTMEPTTTGRNRAANVNAFV